MAVINSAVMHWDRPQPVKWLLPNNNLCCRQDERFSEDLGRFLKFLAAYSLIVKLETAYIKHPIKRPILL